MRRAGDSPALFFLPGPTARGQTPTFAHGRQILTIPRGSRTMRRHRSLLFYSFPIRLLVLHLRNHLMLVALWVFLVLLMTGGVGHFFGVYYLLLTPEYHGEVNFWSFFLTGAACGAFFLIWHLTTYLLCSTRFPFLATLEAPFTKFALNNSVIPVAFLLTYLLTSIRFQAHDELADAWEIVRNIVGFLAGMGAMVVALAVYLHLTNKDLASFLRPGQFVPKPGSRLLAPGGRLPTLREIRSGSTRWRVDTYLTERLRLRPVRSVEHYNKDILGKVFRQNHLNAVVVQITAVLLLMFLGLFMEKPWARIPTGATIFLFASMFMALFGAIVFWYRRWAVLVFVAMMMVVNFATGLGFFHYRNRAYGLDYSEKNRAEYSHKTLNALSHPDTVAQDVAHTRRILENWLAKNRAAGVQRPKMVFVCVSGGGIRSSLWTMLALQRADEATGGRLLRQTMLMSGASGGILGAAYLRELYLRRQEGEPIALHDPGYVTDMGLDLLNPVSFAIISNDLFFPFGTFQSGGHRYRKDRGYLFEHQLNENCRGMLGRRLADYRLPETEARVPMLLVSPFLLNDARRLLISPQGVSYLMRPPDSPRRAIRPEADGVDFGRLFAGQQADSLAFTTALRMNCSYPLILPPTWLPAHPSVEAMDAGFRDNYGIATAVRFAHTFRDWIEENTDGVVVVQVRCWEKNRPIKEGDNKGIVESLFSPFSAAASLTTMQDYEQDNALALLNDVLGADRLQVLRFVYRPSKKENEASMSLHLSKREKMDILDAFNNPEVQQNLQTLKQTLAAGR
ncbi:MAG: patatin-like phospholipase family protein [Lewinellaceae bacterium]|nr:patatin-like phospholipase family protein [Lewinellaceae bacterium]